MALSRYVEGVIARGELYLELTRIQGFMIAAEQTPRRDREHVSYLTGIFRALLLAKQLREEPIQHIANHNRRNPENSGTRVADNTTPSVGVGDVLKKDVTRS